jgi:hypothetical protein
MAELVGRSRALNAPDRPNSPTSVRRERHREGAEAVGMTTTLHRGAERTVPELERLLGVDLG